MPSLSFDGQIGNCETFSRNGIMTNGIKIDGKSIATQAHSATIEQIRYLSQCNHHIAKQRVTKLGRLKFSYKMHSNLQNACATREQPIR